MRCFFLCASFSIDVKLQGLWFLIEENSSKQTGQLFIYNNQTMTFNLLDKPETTHVKEIQIFRVANLKIFLFQISTICRNEFVQLMNHRFV